MYKKLIKKIFYLFEKNKEDNITLSLSKKISQKKTEVSKKKLLKEPLLFAEVDYQKKIYKLTIYKKTVINQELGFSSLVITEKDSDYLIHKKYISLFLKDKSFIGFRDKSMYFLREDKSLQNILFSAKKINQLFLTSELLRQNNFSVFRNIISINLNSPTSILIKNSNPFIRLICIIDNNKSLDYLRQYKYDVDVLLLKSEEKELEKITFFKEYEKNNFFSLEKFNINKWIYFIPKGISSLSIPRVIKYNNDAELLSGIKLVLVDNSYKSEFNLLLPIKTDEANLKNIDAYNENKRIDGLIRFSCESITLIDNFESMLSYLTIEELHLRENLYSIYKDKIFSIKNQNDLKSLLKLTLKDGVYYEKI